MLGFCQFCDIEDPKLTEEMLDLHYWKECKFLTSCKHCEQVVEISTLTEHQLEECEAEKSFKQCPRCLLAIDVAIYEDHVASKACRKARGGKSLGVCPLCEQDIPDGENGWKQHLLVDLCPKNPRS